MRSQKGSLWSVCVGTSLLADPWAQLILPDANQPTAGLQQNQLWVKGGRVWRQGSGMTSTPVNALTVPEFSLFH